MTKNEAATAVQDDIDSAASAADQDNPFKVAGTENVVKFPDKRSIPADRLKTKGFLKQPPFKSLYHTVRAQAARDQSAIDNPDIADTIRHLIEAGLLRDDESIADVADHNAGTLAYALGYAANGLHVIDSHAIDPKTGVGTGPQGDAKRPRGAKWQERASNDADTIRSFWTGDGQYPKNKDGEDYRYARVSAPRNVSIAFPEACGMFVLDIDGDDGKRALAELEAKHGQLPKTAKSITGSGGWHFIFRTGRPIRNTASQIAPGVDIRGEGGQIIAPPSIHKTGNFYQWEVAPGDVIADAPEWLVDLAFSATKANAAKDSKGRAHKATGTVNPRTGQSYDSHGFEAILDTIGDHADGGGFDTPIYRAACSWFSANGADIDVTDLQEVLREVILTAECDDARAETRYATDDYLSERIEQARAFILSARPEDSTAEEDMTPDTLAGDLGDASKTPDERAEGFTTQHSEATIYKFIKGLHDEGVDKVVQGNVSRIISKNTSLTKPDVKKFWRELDADKKRREREEAKAKDGVSRAIVVNRTDFRDQHMQAAKLIHDANNANPQVFHNISDLCMIRAGSDGRHGISSLDKDGYANVVNDNVIFEIEVSDDGTRGVSAPRDVVSHLFHADRSAYPPLAGFVTTPSFTANGTLLTQPGYDWESQLVYQPDNTLNIPQVSDAPTEEEVFEAKRLLVQEILADFMLDGMTRHEAIRAILCCDEVDGELVPIEGAKPQTASSAAHAIVMAIFPFVRDMIDGNAPGIAIDKQKAGAGAGKLEASLSAIYAGRGTAAMTLPTTPEEMTKVLMPTLRSGSPNIFFDNISGAVYSGELASAMTAPTYQARVLGKSETVEVAVRCQWVIAGIKLSLSDELIRRFALIYIDPKTATPENRTGFRHPEIEAWVRDNRGDLIWACLTLVQNWIANGRQPGKKDKASYSQWARTMGGILDAAGIKGFLENEKDMKARSSVSDDPVRQLIERLADFDDGALFVTGSVSKRHPAGTTSVKAILEGFHEDEESGDQSLRLPGWGYDSMGDYVSPEKLGRGFKRDVAGETHRVGDWDISFVDEPNSAKVKLWKLVKVAFAA